MRPRRTEIADRKEEGDARLWGAPISAKVTRKSAPFRGIQLHGVQPNLDQGAEGSSFISHGKPALAVGD